MLRFPVRPVVRPFAPSRTLGSPIQCVLADGGGRARLSPSPEFTTSCHTAARGGVVAMQPLAAAGSTVSGDLWAYLAIFVLVAIGWAGVPDIGGAVIAG